MKEIPIKPPFIKLGQFLKFVDIITAGGDEKSYLIEHSVLVNNVKEERRGRKIYPGDIITIGKLKYLVKLNES